MQVTEHNHCYSKKSWDIDHNHFVLLLLLFPRKQANTQVHVLILLPSESTKPEVNYNLFAPTGALIVIGCYYWSARGGNFFRF